MANSRPFATLALGIALAISATALCLYNYYVFFLNETSHTGIEVREISMMYLIQAVISGALLRHANRKIVVLCLVIGVLGAAEIFLLDYFEVMSFYDDWAPRGLKTRTWGCWFLHCQ